MAVYTEANNIYNEWYWEVFEFNSTPDNLWRTTETWDYRMQEQSTDFLVLENSQ
jgi:hypothetical protein